MIFPYVIQCDSNCIRYIALWSVIKMDNSNPSFNFTFIEFHPIFEITEVIRDIEQYL